MPVLQVEGLVKRYGHRRVVDGVGLEVQPGEVVGLLGPNGAGKTTTFRMICGLIRPDQGKVQLLGEDVTQWPMHRRARERGMGYLPQQSSVFAKLSARDNLIGIMQMLGFSRKQQRTRCQELLEQFQIAHIAKTRAGQLSGGERRRLEIARCLISNPKIIMLDEPFAGIDPRTVQNIQRIIRSLASAGISILITHHDAREILQLTDRTYVVSEGRILVSGTADEILRHQEVREKYLGDLDVSRRLVTNPQDESRFAEESDRPRRTRVKTSESHPVSVEPNEVVEPKAQRRQPHESEPMRSRSPVNPGTVTANPTADMERTAVAENDSGQPVVDTRILKFHSAHVKNVSQKQEGSDDESSRETESARSGRKRSDRGDRAEDSSLPSGAAELPEVVFVRTKRPRGMLAKLFDRRKSG